MYRSILVPLDGSEFGEQALAPALDLARRAGAQLHMVHVVPISPVTDASDAVLREHQELYLDDLVQRLRTSWDVPITTRLLDGSVAETLHDYALTIRVDLVVMATHGRGALSRFWLDSIADSLIRRVPMPVLLVHPHEKLPDLAHERVFRHILLPLDGSLLAERMLRHATALGRLAQAEYTLLQAIEPPATGYGTELYAVTTDEQTIGSLRTRVETYLDHVAARLRAQDLRVHIAVVIDEPAAAILEYAREHAVDLIALETHGHSGLARWLVGGVADKVVRGASVPVLLHYPEGATAR